MAKTQAVHRVSSTSANPAKTRATKSAAHKTAVASGQKASPATKPAKSKAATRKAAIKTAPRKSTKSPANKAPAKLGKSSTAGKYSDPELRERIKAKVMREDKGGRAGQWSARKAQLVAHEYEAAGGTYKGARDEQQKSLTEWKDEHWTTEDGKPARRKDGMHRYLPEKAWEQLSPAEKRSTEKKKLAGDHQGKQFVANTQAAVKARRSAEK